MSTPGRVIFLHSFAVPQLDESILPEAESTREKIKPEAKTAMIVTANRFPNQVFNSRLSKGFRASRQALTGGAALEPNIRTPIKEGRPNGGHPASLAASAPC
jgi:hypothetical protein